MFFFLMIRRPPRSTLDRSSAASDVYKRQGLGGVGGVEFAAAGRIPPIAAAVCGEVGDVVAVALSLIHISETTRPY